MPQPTKQGPIKRSPRSPRPSEPLTTDWVLRKQAEVLEEHEKRIANHTAIQSWTAIISLAMSVITTIALIFIAYSQYQVSQRQVELEYAKSAPQFYASVSMRRGTADWGISTGLELPTDVSLRLVHGDITIKSISVVQEVHIRRTHDTRLTDTPISCAITFGSWFQLGPDQLEDQADQEVFKFFPNLNFTAADGKPAYIDKGPTRIFVKYDDLFGKEHLDVVSIPVFGEPRIAKDVDDLSALESPTAYFIAIEKRQPFNVFRVPSGCKGILTEE
jgi:hypothetical protein